MSGPVHRLCRRGQGDAGAADALGLALIAPAAIGIALAILFISRGVDTRATTQNAAEAAAQAAARERSFSAAAVAADRVGAAMLTDETTCASPSVSVGVGPEGFVPGGVVSATVSCTTSVVGLEIIGASDTEASATAYAVIDAFRGVDL